MATTTLLELSTIDLPPYSARGLTQTLTPIAAAGVSRRTINGTLVDLSDPAFRKYASTVTCSDFQSPAFDGVRIGQIVTVKCVVELSYKIEDPDEDDPPGTDAARTPVTGSVRDSGGYRFYRPQLSMMVMSFDIDRDEWGAQTGWSITFEEV